MDPESPADPLASGQQKFQAGDKEGAHQDAVRATEQDPHSESAWWLRAQATANVDEALSCLEQVIQLNPENIRAREQHTLLQMQNLREAVQQGAKAPGRWEWLGQINWLGLTVGILIVVGLGAGITYGYPLFTSYLARPNAPQPAIAANALQLPPTWTPTATATPTLTATPTWTGTPTDTPTNTPTDTPTAIPTSIPPPPRPVIAPRPTVPPPPTYRAMVMGCYHAGQTFVEGAVSDQTGAPLNGVRVRLAGSPGGQPIAEDISGSHADHAWGYYLLWINPGGPKRGTWYVWVVRDDGSAASAPQSIQTNRYKADSPHACWRAVINFVRQSGP
jgi:hypothetical protein